MNDAPARMTRLYIALEAEAQRRAARPTMLIGMVVGGVLTVVGNVVAVFAAKDASTLKDSTVLAVTVYVMAPLVAAWAAWVVHTLWTVGSAVRANVVALTESTALFRAAVGVGVAAFAIAFGVSYDHLRAVCTTAGLAPWAAVAFPITIDSMLMVCTASYFSMRPASEADLRLIAEQDAERAEAERARRELEATKVRIEQERRTAETAALAAKEEADRMAANHLSNSVPNGVSNGVPTLPVQRVQRGVSSVPWTADTAAQIAEHLVSNAATAKPLGVVQQVLVGLTETGASHRSVATAAGISPTTVGDLRKAAELVAESRLATVAP